MDLWLAGGQELQGFPQGQHQGVTARPGATPRPGSRAAGGRPNPGIRHLREDRAGLRPGRDVSPGWVEQNCGRAGQFLGQELMPPGWAAMGSWAVARVGGDPRGGGEGQSDLIALSGP